MFWYALTEKRKERILNYELFKFFIVSIINISNLNEKHNFWNLSYSNEKTTVSEKSKYLYTDV